MSNVDVSWSNMVDALKRFREAWRGTVIGSLLGFFVGILPARATPGSLMSYGVTKMLSRNPEECGKGASMALPHPTANNSASLGRCCR